VRKAADEPLQCAAAAALRSTHAHKTRTGALGGLGELRGRRAGHDADVVLLAAGRVEALVEDPAVERGRRARAFLFSLCVWGVCASV
jgi:hypothetical protein